LFQNDNTPPPGGYSSWAAEGLGGLVVSLLSQLRRLSRPQLCKHIIHDLLSIMSEAGSIAQGRTIFLVF